MILVYGSASFACKIAIELANDRMFCLRMFVMFVIYPIFIVLIFTIGVPGLLFVGPLYLMYVAYSTLKARSARLKEARDRLKFRF